MKPEQMRVSALCEEMQDEVDKILAKLPPNARKLADHLERSSESAGLNLDEGLVAFKPKVKASFFDICRRETSEVRKAMRRLVRRKFLALSETYPADRKADALIGMMIRMIKIQEARAEQE